MLLRSMKLENRLSYASLIKRQAVCVVKEKQRWTGIPFPQPQNSRRVNHCGEDCRGRLSCGKYSLLLELEKLVSPRRNKQCGNVCFFSFGDIQAGDRPVCACAADRINKFAYAGRLATASTSSSKSSKASLRTSTAVLAGGYSVFM